MVEREEALDAEMAAAEDLFVEVSAKFLEVVETVRHGSSGLAFCHTLARNQNFTPEGIESTEVAHPLGICIDVQGKGLLEKGFVTICKQRVEKSTSNDNAETQSTRSCRRGSPTPRCVCVNAVDKGVSERFGVKAVDKGVMALGDCGNNFSGGEKKGLDGDTVQRNLALEITAFVAAFRSPCRTSFVD
jgi:hypothetical protein